MENDLGKVIVKLYDSQIEKLNEVCQIYPDFPNEFFENERIPDIAFGAVQKNYKSKWNLNLLFESSQKK